MSLPAESAASARLAQLEEVVERGLATFVDVGSALLEIRDGRLYRETHGTFEAYCRDRWAIARSTANQLVAAARVVAAIADTAPIPANEAQARELVPLLDKPDELREAWVEASANGAPTASGVRQVVGRVLGVPVDEELLERQQRETLIQGLERAVYALEGPPSTAQAEARRLLVDGDPGPFTPSRFERVAAYATAFAGALRKAGVNG